MPRNRLAVPVRLVVAASFGVGVACGTTTPTEPLPPPPGFLASPRPYVAPSDTVARVGDSIQFRVANTVVPDSIWRWEVSDTAIAGIGSKTGLAHARAVGSTSVQACSAYPTGPICALTTLKVE